MLRAGVLGELVGGQLSFCHPGLLDAWFDGEHRWLLDPRRASGGALFGLGLHLVDLLHWLAPERELTARGASLHTRPDLAVELGGAALLDPVSMHTSWCARPGGLTVTLWGNLGTACLRDGSLSCEPSGPFDLHGPPPDAGTALAEFLQSLHTDEPPDQLDDAVRAVEVMYALLAR